MMEQEFEEYLRKARFEFTKVVDKYSVENHLELRTAINSFLIAYDQAVSMVEFQIDRAKLRLILNHFSKFSSCVQSISVEQRIDAYIENAKFKDGVPVRRNIDLSKAYIFNQDINKWNESID